MCNINAICGHIYPDHYNVGRTIFGEWAFVLFQLFSGWLKSSEYIESHKFISVHVVIGCDRSDMIWELL